MTSEGSVTLDSYRLAQYSVQVPCYVCEEPNTFDAELCRHCFAPMALTHQANTQKLHPQMVATIGPSGVGKTVYLGMLIDMLSRDFCDLQLLARGAFSITLQQTTTSALSRCDFPVKTPTEPDSWNWVHCQVNTPKRKRPVELVMPDMAGEAIIEECDHPNSYKVIRSFLTKCEGVMIMVDASSLRGSSREQDYFTMKLLSYLSELDDDPKRSWSQRPVALILSKADESEECFNDPSGYAEAHASGLWQMCRERFQRHKFFASSVAGACAYRPTRREGRVRVPLRIEPRGIIEPFDWLLSQLKP